MNRFNLTGISSFISFLQILDKDNIKYDLSRRRDDSVMITIHIVGRRLELDFFQDHIEYSWYDGDESVHDNQAWLYDVLEEWVRE